MSELLNDRVVLVIGRASGIARAVAAAASQAGAHVVVAGRDKDALSAAYNGTNITAEAVDVTNEASIAELAGRLGAVDHVVSTASARARGTYDSLDPETMLLSFSTKVIGPILLAKHFTERMPADGSFVFFSGTSARKPSIGMLAVGATNGAVDVVTRSLAVELAPIRVNAISPGTIDTGAYDGLGEHKAQLFATKAQTSPARRIGTSNEIADAVMFALTNTFMTGVSLSLDGGEALV
jgi:NAD(P)-dependent dehydrogenase (short-subunit alcohol dehydrogenase family)